MKIIYSLTIIGMLFSNAVVAQNDTSMYNTGNQFHVTQPQPVYIAPIYSQPAAVQSMQPSNNYINNLPTQHVCTMYGNVLRCN